MISALSSSSLLLQTLSHSTLSLHTTAAALSTSLLHLRHLAHTPQTHPRSTPHPRIPTGAPALLETQTITPQKTMPNTQPRHILHGMSITHPTHSPFTADLPTPTTFAAHPKPPPHSPFPTCPSPLLDLAPQSIYVSTPTPTLLRSLLVLSATQLPLFDSLATSLPGLLSTPLAPALTSLVRGTFFSQFCGGETVEECVRKVEEMRGRGVRGILDYAVEGSEGEKGCEEVMEMVKVAVEAARKVEGMACVKVTGLAGVEVLERAARGGRETEEMERAVRRMDEVCWYAARRGVPMLIDAEQYAIQPAVERMAMLMQERHNTQSTVWVFSTVQMYLKESAARIQVQREVAEKKGFRLGLKLVRGAYLEQEREIARMSGVESPIHETAQDTHESYDRAVAEGMAEVKRGRMSLVVATHNEASLRKAAEVADALGVDRHDENLRFAQLYGMGDSLTTGMQQAGFNVLKYVPFGPVKDVLPYLARRVQENKCMLSGARKEMRLIMTELKNRGFFFGG